MSTLQLDERALRRPDWAGGRPIRLMDGQDWLFPSVDFDWQVSLPDEGPPRLVMAPELDPELVRELREVFGVALRFEWSLPRYFNIGRLLLLRNYRLEETEIVELFPLKPGTEAHDRAMTTPGLRHASRAADVLSPFGDHIARAMAKLSRDGVTLARANWHFPEAVAALRGGTLFTPDGA